MIRSSDQASGERLVEQEWLRPVPMPDLPLADEAHVDAWRRYERRARKRGAVPTLRDSLIQLQLPIATGISASTAYRQAVRTGLSRVPWTKVAADDIRRPDAVEIHLHRTAAGTLPVIRADDRRDFVTLLRALAGRGEPIDVPDSMGACLVQGLTNWDRVRRYRRAWEAEWKTPPEPGAWRAEFAALRVRRELYQDRFLLVSAGEYSGVCADVLGLEVDEWLARSAELRLAHEATHYLVLRIFGQFPNRVLDELVADMAGLVQAFGNYSGDLALRFLGLETLPRYRRGGRLENYCRHSVGSDDFAELAGMTVDAVREIEKLVAGLPPADEKALLELIVDLTASNLDLLAVGHVRRVGVAEGVL